MAWKSDAPSGFTQTWRLWRHCCCRYGWYPLLIVPIVTLGCLLSLYSSFGCDFVELEVGFTPSNRAWNQSEAHLGLFYMYTGKEGGNKYADTILEGCEWYSDSFELAFIEGDRTWKVARIMALISGAASITATLTSWLFLFSPLPASFFWPGLLLPAILVAFLAEGSKFLMFDTAACRVAVWTPSGVDSLAQRAESCELGDTAVYTIVSGCVFFIALMLVCLKAPDKRLLDEHYGRRYDDNNHIQEHNNVEDMESAMSAVEYESQGSYPRGSDVYVVGEEVAASPADRSVGDYESVSGRSGRSGRSGKSRGSARSGRSGRSRNMPQELKTVPSSESSSDTYPYNGNGRSNRDGRESKSAKRLREDSTRDDPVDATNASRYTKELQPIHEKKPNAGYDDRMSAAEIAIRRSEQQRISESRVCKIEKMELSSHDDSDDLIQKFVTDLNLSFQQDDLDSDKSLRMNSSVHSGRSSRSGARRSSSALS